MASANAPTDAAALELRQALGEGDLPAFVLCCGERKPIPQGYWQSDQYRMTFLTGEVGWWLGPHHLPISMQAFVSGPVLIPESDFTAWLASLGRAATPAGTIGAEGRLTDHLAQLMQAAPNAPRSKSAIRSELPPDLARVSNRGFERAWTAAVKASGAVLWSASGRRKSS